MTHDPSQPDRPATPPPSRPPPGTIDLPLPGGAGSTFSTASPGSSSSTSPGGFGATFGLAGAPAAGGANGDGPPRLTGHRRQRVVAVGIVATTLLSLLAVSVLYYRWAKKPDPTAIIVVWGGNEPAWDGATAVVRGGGLRAPLSYVLRAEEHLLVRFHVPPGDYQVEVRGKNGAVLARRQNPVQRPLKSGVIWWPFRAPPAATQAGLQ